MFAGIYSSVAPFYYFIFLMSEFSELHRICEKYFGCNNDFRTNRLTCADDSV